MRYKNKWNLNQIKPLNRSLKKIQDVEKPFDDMLGLGKSRKCDKTTLFYLVNLISSNEKDKLSTH